MDDTRGMKSLRSERRPVDKTTTLSVAGHRRYAVVKPEVSLGQSGIGLCLAELLAMTVQQ